MYSTAVKNATIEFVKRYGDGIINAIADTGLYFPAVVAQKAYESGWGKSELAAKYNNLGGITSTLMPDTGRVTLNTGAGYKKQFVTYPSVKLFFQDYVRVLNLPHYKNAGVFEAISPEDQIMRIVRGGYDPGSTPEGYLKNLQGILDATRDIYKIGKISTKAVDPVLLGQPGQSIMTGVFSSIASSLNIGRVKTKTASATDLQSAKTSIKSV